MESHIQVHFRGLWLVASVVGRHSGPLQLGVHSSCAMGLSSVLSPRPPSGDIFMCSGSKPVASAGTVLCPQEELASQLCSQGPS